MLQRLLASIALTLCAGPAWANPASEAYVNQLVQNLQQVETGKESDFIVNHVDMPRLSTFVLGKHARFVSIDERDQFATRLDRFLRDFLASRSSELATAEVAVTTSTDRTDTDSIVTTRVSSPYRDPTTMRWRVLHRDGEWRLVDVEVHGLWLAIEQRAQVVLMLDERGVEVADLYLASAAN